MADSLFIFVTDLLVRRRYVAFLPYEDIKKSGSFPDEPLFSGYIKDYLFAFLASAFLVTSYIIGVAMKIEA